MLLHRSAVTVVEIGGLGIMKGVRIQRLGRFLLEIPKLHQLFKCAKILYQTAIIERYRRREASVEGASIEMYSGVSAWSVEDIREVLWSSKVSPGQRIKIYSMEKNLDK